jgi:hypothetical protein
MSVKRMGLLTGCVLTLVFSIGAVQSGAAGSPRVLTFASHDVLVTWFGPQGKGSPAYAATKIGSTAILTARIYNRTTQFGKPPGTAIGRLLLDCSVLNIPADGLCTGIVHVPDGYFMIGGNGPFVTSPRRYAITGGVGPYANARGQLTITTTSARTSLLDVVVIS